MSKKLSGKVAIVTGASKGIGAGNRQAFGGGGSGCGRQLQLQQGRGRNVLLRRLPSKDGKAVAVQANVSRKADIERLFAEARKAFGRLDILVNNAGIYEIASLGDITEEHFHKLFDVNVLGLLLASREAAKHFGAAGGSIINISSVASTLTPPNFVGL